MSGARAASSKAALLAIVVGAGIVSFLAVRDDPAPPPPTTTTTTPAPTTEEIAAAITASLADGLEVAVSTTEAECITDSLFEVLGQGRVEGLAAETDLELADDERDALVRAVVDCLPPDKAGGLLRETPSSTVVAELPGEGDDTSGP